MEFQSTDLEYLKHSLRFNLKKKKQQANTHTQLIKVHHKVHEPLLSFLLLILSLY